MSFRRPFKLPNKKEEAKKSIISKKYLFQLLFSLIKMINPWIYQGWNLKWSKVCQNYKNNK